MFCGLPKALRTYHHSSGYGFGRSVERITVRSAAVRAAHIDATREVPLDSVRAPAPRLDQTIERLALEQALERLTPGVRRVFLLKVVEGYSDREIGAMLRIGVGASEVRLHRARRKLRRILRDRPVDRAARGR